MPAFAHRYGPTMLNRDRARVGDIAQRRLCCRADQAAACLTMRRFLVLRQQNKRGMLLVSTMQPLKGFFRFGSSEFFRDPLQSRSC
jgi:hypothetical protein